MLTRSSQIGEFYVMAPPQVYPGGPEQCKFSCDLMVYDEESDRHVRIQWADAVEACLTGVAAPTEPKVSRGPGKEGMGLSTWNDKAAAWTAFNKGQKKDGSNIEERDFGTGDLDLDVRIVVARPFIEHLMHNAILTVAGRDTGATLFGPADMCVPLRVEPQALARLCALLDACSLSRPLAGSSRQTRR